MIASMSVGMVRLSSLPQEEIDECIDWLAEECTFEHVDGAEYILFLGCHESAVDWSVPAEVSTEPNVYRGPAPYFIGEENIPNGLVCLIDEAWEDGYDYLCIYF